MSLRWSISSGLKALESGGDDDDEEDEDDDGVVSTMDRDSLLSVSISFCHTSKLA